MAVIAWALGGYLGAMLLGRVGGMRMRSLRQLGERLLVLGGYAVASAALVAAVLDPSAAGGQTPPQMMNAFWRAINPVMPNRAAPVPA